MDFLMMFVAFFAGLFAPFGKILAGWFGGDV